MSLPQPPEKPSPEGGKGPNASPTPASQPAAPAPVPEPKKAPPPPPAPPKAPPFTINHESRKRELWGFWVCFVVASICIVVPLRIGFQMFEWRGWVPSDVITDVTLALDIIIVSLTTYEVEGEVVKDRSLIFKRYLKSWFVPDILSVIPLEIIAAGLHKYNPLYRVNRLIRVAQLVLFFMNWEKYTKIKPTYIRIAKSAVLIVALAHFIGCIFSLVVIIEGADATEVFTGVNDMMIYPLYSRYVRSFYWSFVTMTGYNNTSPATQFEAIFSIFVTVMGISLFATIIGTVGSLVTNLDSSKLYFRQKMDGINDYMAYKKIPDEIQAEVRNFYNYLWKSGKGLDKNQELQDLPPYLLNKMSLYLNKEIITKVPMFSKFKDDEAFITEIVKCLKSRVSLPNSFVVRKGEIGTEMYFVSRGELNVVTDDEKVIFTITDGGFFGEIALIYETKRTATIVARTYCDMFILTKDDFMNVKEKFPLQVAAIEEEAAERKKANQMKDQEKKTKEAEAKAKAAAEAEAKAREESEARERAAEEAKRVAAELETRMANAAAASALRQGPPASGSHPASYDAFHPPVSGDAATAKNSSKDDSTPARLSTSTRPIVGLSILPDANMPLPFPPSSQPHAGGGEANQPAASNDVRATHPAAVEDSPRHHHDSGVVEGSAIFRQQGSQGGGAFSEVEMTPKNQDGAE